MKKAILKNESSSYSTATTFKNFYPSKIHIIEEEIIPNQNKANKPKTRFDYLYINSKVRQIKSNEKLEKLEKQEKKERTPKITKKAQNIKRNPNLFHKRLYNNKIQELTLEETIEEKDLYSKNEKMNKKLKKFYQAYNLKTYKSAYSFTPKLDKNSLSFANSLSINPMERLLKPSKSQQQYTQSLKQKKLDEEKEKTKQEKESKMKFKPKSYKKNYRSIMLYKKGIQQKQKKDEKIKQKQIEIENSYSQYTYAPNLNKSDLPNKTFTNYGTVYPYYSFSNTNDFYSRNKMWKQYINEKYYKLYHTNNMSKIYSECSFSPRINHSIMNDDNIFIERNYSDFNNYVNKQKKIRENKALPAEIGENIEFQKNRTFIKNSENSYSKYLNYSKSCSNLGTSAYSINHQRNKLKVENFFSPNDNDEDENKEGGEYFNDEEISIYSPGNDLLEHSFALSNAIKNFYDGRFEE